MWYEMVDTILLRNPDPDATKSFDKYEPQMHDPLRETACKTSAFHIMLMWLAVGWVQGQSRNVNILYIKRTQLPCTIL